MIDQRNVIALIPARGGSKGVRRKNLRVVGGHPLIHFTLAAARGVRQIDLVYVSSDDDEILKYASQAGALTVRRPNALAGDTTSAVEVVQHFATQLPEDIAKQNPYIIYLQPTSPLRTSQHIEAALSKMDKADAHTIVSVRELEKSPYKSFKLDANGMLESLFDERLSNARRQDLPVTYIPNGAIYVFRISDFAERGGFPSNGSLPYVMNDIDSLDVDTEEDLRRLEIIIGTKNG